jgi:hypothetical protein
MDVTQLILDDHHEQRRLFSILEQIDRADTGPLAAVWGRLSTFLEVHAQAEEEIFYPELLKVGGRTGHLSSVEAETLDAIGDHNEIRDTIAAVADQAVGTDGWWDAVAAVNKANGDHMAEEEREGLTDFRREAGLPRRHELAVAFIAFEARHYTGVEPVDKDPAGYVREAEAEELAGDDAAPGAAAPGSLGIGSLKGS